MKRISLHRRWIACRNCWVTLIEEREEKYVGYRVIADHGRAATFLIGDGVRPAAPARAMCCACSSAARRDSAVRSVSSSPSWLKSPRSTSTRWAMSTPKSENRRDHISADSDPGRGAFRAHSRLGQLFIFSKSWKRCAERGETEISGRDSLQSVRHVRPAAGNHSRLIRGRGHHR